jgi:hypothetical protein
VEAGLLPRKQLRVSLCGVPGRFDRDLVTESFQSADEIAFEAICIEPIEVVTPQIAVIALFPLQVVRNDQNAVGDRDDGTLFG